MAVVSRMKIERLRNGHTLETLGKSTKVAHHRLWQIENGLLPKPNEMKIIAEVLEVNLWEIFPCFPDEMYQEYFITG